MLGKFLITLAVILTAFFVIRQRNIADSAKKQAGKTTKPIPKDQPKEVDSHSSDLRFAAYTFLVLIIGLGATLYYFQWQDDHQILTISLHRENQAQPVIYQVYKYQLENRTFVTIEGTVVTVASSERMEVAGLD